MKRLMFATLILSPLNSMAQLQDDAILLEETNFFISLIAGVLLAVGFQLLLTAASVAGGITAIGNVKQKAHQSGHSGGHNSNGSSHTVKTVSAGLGLWTLITTSISLFFASLLAVKLGFIGVNFVGATLGLVIWATFFMLITYLEISAVSSLIGGLTSTVKQGLSSASSVFSKSGTDAAKDVARVEAKEDARQMRKQFEKMFSTHDVDKKVEQYISKLEPQHLDIKKLKKQLKDLLTDVQVTEKADYEHPDAIKKIILEEADKSTLSKEHKEAIKEHVQGMKDIAQSDADPKDKAKAAITELSPADQKQVEKYQQKITEVLRNTSNEEFQPQKLEEDLKKILNEPGQATQIVKAKASAMDRETLVDILAAQNMNRQQAEQRVNQAQKVLDKVSSFFEDGQQKSSATGDKMKQKSSDLQHQVRQLFAGSTGNIERVYSDFVSIFNSSGTGPDLKYKLEHYNKGEMAAMIVNKTSLSRNEAETIAEKVVSARDAVLEKAHEVENKVNEKMTEAREKALDAAEKSRKAAAIAAWWLVATAVISAAASAVGGMLALEGVL